MAEIRVENVVKTFGQVRAVDHVNLNVRNHECIVLLGPNGCGKTTLLRAIAGLGEVDEGRILIGGRDVTHLSPKDRNISMVFQSYVTFPHMKVYDNIAFGLKMKRVAKKEVQQRVQWAAELLHIEDYLERLPSQLSGGQRQRVAVARAIAVQPQVLLMDEPLSNLDAPLRQEMRVELKRLLAKLRTTTIYVTHDHSEAMNMGNRIAVMRGGRILQFDTPTTVYDMPRDQFVGGFIGNPPMNLIEGQLRFDGDEAYLYLENFAIRALPELSNVLARYDGRPIIAGIRAENMEVLPEPAPDALSSRVFMVEPLGSYNLLTI